MSPIFYHSRKLVITIFNKLQKSTFTTLSSTFQSTTSQHIIKLSNKNIVTTVTNQASIVEKWLTNITSLYKTSPLIIGIDCEWKPQFTKGASINKVAVLQLCVDENCILLQLLHMDHIPTMLKEFLNNPRVTLVGVGLKADLTRLRKSHEIECSCAVEDISVLAVKTPGLGFEGRPYPSLRNLALGILGTTKEDSKRVTFSNWEARVLSEGQIMYACLDAALSYQIGYKLLKQG
ncbi:DNA helicase [Ranunculus cassubicifolius]